MTAPAYPAVLPALLRLRDGGSSVHPTWSVQVDAIEFFVVKDEPIHIDGALFSGVCAAYKGYAMEPKLDAVLFVAGRDACALAQVHLAGLDNYPLEAQFELRFCHLENAHVFYGVVASIRKYVL